MKIKEGFVLRHVMDSDIVVDVTGKFSGVIKLNSTSADIWKYIADGLTIPEAAEKLAKEYNVSKEQALKDTESFCAAMLQQKFFEE